MSIEEAAKEYAEKIRTRYNKYTINQFDMLVIDIWEAAATWQLEQFKAQEQADDMLCALKIPINEQERTNVLLVGALRFLNEEQKIALRDALIERTPKAQRQKANNG